MKFLPALTLLLLTAAACPAVIVDIPASQDATLYESPTGSLANGGGDYFFAGRTLQNSGSRRRGLIEFDVASFLPAGATINSATLTLHASLVRTPGTVISAHRLTREWKEGTTDANGNEGQGISPVLGNDATWLHAVFNSVFWSGPGAAGDFNAVASGTATILSVNAFYSWTGLENDVRLWLANDGDNHGWLLLGDESRTATAVQFDSRSNPNDDSRPVLRIDYTPVPEPGSTLLAAALTMMSRRRRGAFVERRGCLRRSPGVGSSRR